MSGIVAHLDRAQGSEVTQDAYTRSNALKVALSSGKYADSVFRGRSFSGMTAATGVAPGTSVGTTAAVSLFNPASSGYNLVVLRASLGLISGTLGAGTLAWVVNVNGAAAATTGTAITAVNCLLGNGYTAVGKMLTTATLPATPTVFRPFASLNQGVVATTAINNEQLIEDVDGSIIVPPGMTVSIEGITAAGSSPLVVYGLMWEEVAVG